MRLECTAPAGNYPRQARRAGLFPKLTATGPAASPPIDPNTRVALQIPVRDEAVNLPATLPGLPASDADEVIFFDDGSSDGSAQIIYQAITQLPSGKTLVSVVVGLPRPDGLWHLMAYTAPVALSGNRWCRAVAVLGIMERVLVESKTGSRDWAAAAPVSVSPLAALPVVAQSLRTRQWWKGRSYTASGSMA